MKHTCSQQPKKGSADHRVQTRVDSREDASNGWGGWHLPTTLSSPLDLPRGKIWITRSIELPRIRLDLHSSLRCRLLDVIGQSALGCLACCCQRVLKLWLVGDYFCSEPLFLIPPLSPHQHQHL